MFDATSTSDLLTIHSDLHALAHAAHLKFMACASPDSKYANHLTTASSELGLAAEDVYQELVKRDWR